MQEWETYKEEIKKNNFREINLKNCTNCENYIWWSERNQGCKELNGCYEVSENTICDLYKEN